MIRFPLLAAIFLLLSLNRALADPAADDYDSIVVDATYVPCNDSTESLLVFRSGRAIYAHKDLAVVFSLPTSLIDDVLSTAEKVVSVVDTTKLDSCTTVGVILGGGKRFMLINNARPTPETREVQLRLERLRKFARKKLEQSDSLPERASVEMDTLVMAERPSISPYELRANIRSSPVAEEWGCRGTVVVRVLVGKDGDARRAFVHSVKVRGKCGSLLVTSALQAVLRSTFRPALKKNGKPTVAWTDIEVKFSRK